MFGITGAYSVIEGAVLGLSYEERRLKMRSMGSSLSTRLPAFSKGLLTFVFSLKLLTLQIRMWDCCSCLSFSESINTIQGI